MANPIPPGGDSGSVHDDLPPPYFGHDIDEEDEDDDDISFVPAPEAGEAATDEDHEDDEEDEELYFHDALEGAEFDFEVTETDGEDDEDDDEDDEDDEDDDDEGGGPFLGQAGQGGGPVYITRAQIMQLLGTAGIGRLLAADFGMRRRNFNDEEDEDETESDGGYGGTSRKRRRGREAFQPVPSEEGRKLMDSGTFGTSDRPENTLKRQKRLAYSLMRREMGLGSTGRERNADRLMSQGLIPESKADTIIHYNDKCYSGQFSDDGNFFFSCAQDFKVRMYDTSNPYDWKYYKKVEYPYGSWTITDASLSPDNRFLAYSSMMSVVCLAPTDPDNDSEPNLLDFAHMGRPTTSRAYRSNFRIFSVRFSGDGRELVAGTADRSVYVYDIERRQSVLRIAAHDNDVNAVCFGDAQSPHILYSGSDDTTLKVWDRRSMGDGREAGVFMGHTEGLTYVDSKGDGRYVLSNAKDQTAKLWDLRMMMSKEKADKIDPERYSTHFEYRSNAYDDNDYRPHPHDCSLVTFRGHKVLQTLIRCHFSPPGSTDSRYVYSGSYDGSVYIWNMDATLAGKVDVLGATKNSRPREAEYDYWGRHGGRWSTIVRDASWHPNAPVIAATSWNGYGAANGTCSVHTWNDGMDDDEGEPKMGRRVNAQFQHDERLYRTRASFDDDENRVSHMMGYEFSA